MIRFLLGTIIGLGIGFGGGFVAGLWLMIRADRDVEEMMREPLPGSESTGATAGVVGATSSPTASATT